MSSCLTCKGEKGLLFKIFWIHLISLTVITYIQRLATLWTAPAALYLHPGKAPHLWSLLLTCTCTKQQELPLRTAIAATQETGAPKHIDFLCKRKAVIFLFVTFVVLGAHPNTKISDPFIMYFSPKCCLQRGEWLASCCRTKFWIVLTFL